MTLQNVPDRIQEGDVTIKFIRGRMWVDENFVEVWWKNERLFNFKKMDKEKYLVTCRIIRETMQIPFKDLPLHIHDPSGLVRDLIKKRLEG